MKSLINILTVILFLGGLVALFVEPAAGGSMVLGSVLLRFNNVKDPNTYSGKGIVSHGTAIAYALTLEMPAPSRKGLTYYFDFAQLTGNLTLNATNIVTRVDYEEGDIVYLLFKSDASARTITWGTLFRAGVAATFIIPISGTGVAQCMFLDGKLHVMSQTMLAT